MTSPDQIPSVERLNPEQFVADLESIRECFPVVGGTVGARDEMYGVDLASYHAPMTDFFDDRKLKEHLAAGDTAPTVHVPLEVGPNFRYAFDTGEEWFRIGRGAFLHVAGRKVPVCIVRLDFEGFSTSWLYRDERDIESLTN